MSGTVISENGGVMVLPKEPEPPSTKGKPGWVIPNWAIGPSGPNGESGPFARPY